MAAYTAGELQTGKWCKEDTYATIETGTLALMGDTIELNMTNDDQQEFLILPGSRSFGATQSGPFNKGYDASFYARTTTGWVNFFAKYGMGTTSGLSDHLSAFTGSFDVYDGTTHNYNVWNGCKVNRLTIIGDKIGRAIRFQTQVFSQYHQQDTDKNLTGLQTVTIGADPSADTSAILTWGTNLQLNLAGGGLADWIVTDWKLTVDNHLSRKEGTRVGADAANYPVTLALNEGTRDIILEANAVFDSFTYVNARKNNSAVTAATIVIGSQTITLSTGEFERNDYPNVRQAVGTETVKIRFKTLSIA